MKLVNYASFDPELKKRGIKGLSNVGRGEREIWDQFSHDPDQLAVECRTLAVGAQSVDEQRTAKELSSDAESEHIDQPTVTEALRLTKVRLVQAFFRNAVLSSYEYRCSMCDLAVPQLLTASHIIPWSKTEHRRADPRNGLSLCALHDRAFDRGLLTVDEEKRVMISSQMPTSTSCDLQRVAFAEITGKRLTLPHRFFPDESALAYHRANVFVA